MTITLSTVCEGQTHALEVDDQGQLHPTQHNLRVVTAFSRFGATPPHCIEVVNEWQERYAKERYGILLVELLHAITMSSTKSTWPALQRVYAGLALKYADMAWMVIEDDPDIALILSLKQSIQHFANEGADLTATQRDVYRIVEKVRDTIIFHRWFDLSSRRKILTEPERHAFDAYIEAARVVMYQFPKITTDALFNTAEASLKAAINFTWKRSYYDRLYDALGGRVTVEAVRSHVSQKQLVMAIQVLSKLGYEGELR
jgi:hypothetical protein